MSLWRREQKKLNPLDTVYQFLGFVYSGDDDLTKLNKLLHKNVVSECFNESRITNKKLKYNTLKELLDIFRVKFKYGDFSKNFKLKETNVTCNNLTYTIVTKGEIIIFDQSFRFNKVMDYEETYVLTLESENNTIVRLENVYSAKFVKFLC